MQDFDKLWDYGKPEETHRKFKVLLDKTNAEGQAAYVAQLYTQLARTQSLQDSWDQAYGYLDKANKYISDADTTSRIRYLLELGRTYNSSGKTSLAYDTFLEAWELGKSSNVDGYTVDAGHMLAIASDTPDKTLKWNLESVKVAQNSNQPEAQRWLGSLYNNLGWTYFDADDYQTALSYFDKALAEQEKLGLDENIRIAKLCIGKVKRILGDREDALNIQKDLLAEYQAIDLESEYVYEELALCYAEQGDSTRASHYAKLAYNLLSQDKWMVENQSDRLAHIKTLIK